MPVSNKFSLAKICRNFSKLKLASQQKIFHVNNVAFLQIFFSKKKKNRNWIVTKNWLFVNLSQLLYEKKLSLSSNFAMRLLIIFFRNFSMSNNYWSAATFLFLYEKFHLWDNFSICEVESLRQYFCKKMLSLLSNWCMRNGCLSYATFEREKILSLFSNFYTRKNSLFCNFCIKRNRIFPATFVRENVTSQNQHSYTK